MVLENQGTCHDAHPHVGVDGFHVPEILCGVGVAHIDSHTEVELRFVVEQVEEAGLQFRKMFQVDIKIREMVFSVERHEIDLVVKRISLSQRLDRGNLHILLRSCTTLSTIISSKSAIMLTTFSYFHIDTFRHFHRAAIGRIAEVTMVLTRCMKLT